MAPPENERGRPGQDAPGKLAAKLATEDQSTAPVVAVDRSGVAMLDRELRELLGALPASYPTTHGALTDAERLAMALCDTFGPTWCRRLAVELLDTAADVLAARREVVPDV